MESTHTRPERRAQPDRPASRARNGTAADGATAVRPVQLLEALPELGERLAPADVALATRYLVAPGLALAKGRWTPPERADDGVAVVVVRGFVVRDCWDFGRAGAQLFGPEDVFDARLLRAPTSAWRVVAPAEIAVVDERLLDVARRWPGVLTALTRKLLDGQNEQHMVAAVATLPHVEERVLALLGHLSTRWGHVTPRGVSLALPLTHELLGRIVGARRPTVSLALTALRADGRLADLPDGRWLLPNAAADPGQAA